MLSFRQPILGLVWSSVSIFAFAFACSGPGDDTDGFGPDGSGGTAGPGAGGLGNGSDGVIDDDSGIVDIPPDAKCGNGLLDANEACDDGNNQGGDGCLANCLAVESGFTCPTQGAPCFPYARCGDGLVSPPEQCDAGATPQPGCTDNCKVALGFKCTGEPSTCTATVCGDGLIEGTETCDDGTAQNPPVPFDGCNEHCQAEPYCGPNGCTSSCGDGVVLQEECDDGNKEGGDGCSSTCVKEPGYVCTRAPCEQIGGACVLKIPVVYRDFQEAHEDFQVTCGNQVNGVTDPLLDADGKPKVAAGFSLGQVCISSASSFATWYRDTGAPAIVRSLTLFSNGADSYVNRYGANGEKWNGLDGNPLFFPLDNGQGTVAKIPQEVYGGGWNNDPSGTLRNFHFTSEVTHWFQYDSSKTPVLSFTGDDDVWVFINRRLAVDVGGLHVPIEKSVTINASAASNLNLVNGKVYEIKVFHAERKREGSSFKLTLAGFDTSRSDCTAECGDGIIGGTEECDDGVNDGGYNECQPGCKLGGYCGDGIKQDGETCDDAAVDAPKDCRGCRIVVVR